MQRQTDISEIVLEDAYQYQNYFLYRRTFNDAETARCIWDCIRGCVSISDQCFCIHRVWMTLKNDSETARCKGDQIRALFDFLNPL